MSLPSVKASMITFVFLSLLASFHSKISEAASANRAYVCPKEPNFTPNSTYQSNLNHLLSSLSSNAILETGLYNTTVGHNPPNIVYGLFLCRSDVTPYVCQDCVSTATKDIVQHYCPTGIEATIWYDQCILRYSNETFFSSMTYWPKYYSCNDSKITVLDRFDQILGTMINDSVTRATGARDEPGATKFATKEASLSPSIKLYSLVQCTPDISSYNCDKCLRGLTANIPFSCSRKQRAIALTPNCNFRYEAYQFYRNLATPPPRSGKSRISSLTIIAIVTPIAVSMVLLAMVCCLQRMSARKKSPMEEENGNEQSLFISLVVRVALIYRVFPTFAI
ncbi:cysteine-rich receptor-like protein kinase 25 [Quercus suber]|uniref:Cysteine-rich receptor-like protein kinase 25 n=1 Tax=Quercus suber TaxID=58331 RepID=A0AAW0KV74_QUESU